MEEPIVIIRKNEMVLIFNDYKITQIYDKEKNKIIIIKDYFKEDKIEIEKY
jgi:hypothetical protein